MAKKTSNIGYVEPLGYFSKEARKAAGIGEYAESGKKKATSSGTGKKKVKRK